MKTGFVLGKFMPLHKGHIGLFDFARRHCDRLLIIVCYTPSEPIRGETRLQWVQLYASQYDNITVVPFPYDEMLLPNTCNLLTRNP
jgi:HTH-type transcriptional repressor of NAD biosynthesis genes